jgi:hypothetical protein
MKTYTGTLYIHVLDNLYVIIYIKFYFNSIMTKLMVTKNEIKHEYYYYYYY